MLTYQLWDKTTSINGVEASKVLQSDPTLNNGTIYLVYDGVKVTRIEDLDTIKSVYSLSGTDTEVMDAFIEILNNPPVVEETPEEVQKSSKKLQGSITRAKRKQLKSKGWCYAKDKEVLYSTLENTYQVY